ncbi:MAG TPA: glutamine ABC transporter ATP-binding protein, partial [Firmicutes bacterium]|nr:glutamine ABC transporter ATP-binding protein [Bacillota bacterium]
MLRIEGMSKSFGTLEVLKDVSLHVHKGEVVVIIG